MAQSMASSSSLSALRSSSHLQGLQSRASTRTNLPAFYRLGRDRPIGLILRAQQSNPNSDAGSSRRQVIGLVAAGIASGSFVQAVFAEARSIKIGPPPPPSGGLPGTLNSDEARDLEKPLKERFYLQPLSPSEAAQRVKESAMDIVNVKGLIDKKAWPYVQNDLRTKAEYLRYDLKTIISAKPKDQKKSLKELTSKLFDNINNLDYAAKIKSTPQAEKYYAETVSTLNEVLSKLG